MAPLKEIPAQVTPGVAKATRRDRTRPLPSPGFGPSGRTVSVQIPTASTLHAYSHAQPVPGTSRRHPIRSRIAANNLRGTATSAIWNTSGVVLDGPGAVRSCADLALVRTASKRGIRKA
jgi:hypothetical protein